VKFHHLIRSEEACYLSSSKAIELAKKTGARLHVYHLSTAKETELFRNDIPLKDKKITAEVCVHHLHFTNEDYETKGSLIKWNPAVKTEKDKNGLWEALLDDRIDVIATDHAPHTLEEKSNKYLKCPSGAPLVQHSLNVMLEYYKNGKISLEKIVEKMCHNPAILFEIEKRGFIKEGYKADLVLVDLNKEYTVSKENILYKCGWSPLENEIFHSEITHTFVNGFLAFENGKVSPEKHGERLLFER
jgi:dihydroorotase